MLEQLFGSRTRTKLLKIFFLNPEKAFFVRELTRRIDTQINSVRRELQNLVSCGIIKEKIDNGEHNNDSDEIQFENTKFETGQKNKPLKSNKIDKQAKKYFTIDNQFVLYPQLKEVFLKSPLLVKDLFLKEHKNFGTIEYASLAGFFVGVERSPVDVFIIGDIQRHKLTKFIQSIERDFEREINYTVMNREEFDYRKSLGDRFLFSILEGKKIILIDTLIK